MSKKIIYESPDGGKTIYRRESGNYNDRKLIIEVDNGYWTTTKFKNFEIEYVVKEK
tara:strand:- start:490 stop:657 length:168 start_codon:yes stop_codon:yes gene_type:complete